jgi:hypothetical protein
VKKTPSAPGTAGEAVAHALRRLAADGIGPTELRRALLDTMPRPQSAGRKPKRLWTYEDVAQLFGVKADTVCAWFGKGGRFEHATLADVIRAYNQGTCLTSRQREELVQLRQSLNALREVDPAVAGVLDRLIELEKRA